MPRISKSAAPALLLLTVFAAAGAPGAKAPRKLPGPPSFVSGEILVKFRPGAPGAARADARARLGARRQRRFRSGAEHWRLGAGQGVDAALRGLARNPHVEYAEPNFLITAEAIPDDPDLNLLYGLINNGQTGGAVDADIDAELAWDVTTGGQQVVVAVLDSGVDYNHPDLAANIWINPNETIGNGVDDDGNGYVDDEIGWNFLNGTADPFDDFGHGTHVAGTIGAVGNNGTGVTGVAWQVSIMPLKFLDFFGTGTVADAVQAIDYAIAMEVDVTNNSWGLDELSLTLRDAVAAADAAGILFVAAAGNSGRDTDAVPHYPSGFDFDNIISVAATDHTDGRYSLTNFGANSVDIAAPGVLVYSTLPGDQYGTRTGTSMATPHVAGAAALLRAVAPEVGIAQLKSRILDHADPIGSMNGLTVTGGRLNAWAALQFQSCANDNQCDDGIFCNGDETCRDQVCLWGAPACDDADPCTADLCDEQAQTCSFPPVPDTETAAGPDGVCDTSDDNLDLFGIDGICGTAADLSGDAVCNLIDNCPGVSNPAQLDTDGDGQGDRCDADPCRREIEMSSSEDYFESNALTFHWFPLPAVAVGGATVAATVEGDYNETDEVAIVFVEGLSLGHVGDSAGAELCTSDSDEFPIYASEMPFVAADGVVQVGVSNSPAVGPFCVYNRHSVTFRYTGELSLGLPDPALGGIGETAGVPVLLSDVTGLGIDSAAVSVRFNPAVLQLAGVTLGDLTQGYALTYDLAAPGEVSFEVTGAVPLTGAGSIAAIEFDVVGIAGDGTPLQITAAVLNGGAFESCARGGRLLAVDCVDADGDGYGLFGDPACPAGTDPDCDDADASVYPGMPESCDGLDNDCDGIVDNPSAPAGVADLSVEDSILFWSIVGETTGYDVVRGNLAALHGSAGDFTVATTACLADDHPDITLAESEPPVPGEGFWFLLRPINCGGNGTYDSVSASQIGVRDAEVDASPTSCP